MRASQVASAPLPAWRTLDAAGGVPDVLQRIPSLTLRADHFAAHVQAPYSGAGVCALRQRCGNAPPSRYRRRFRACVAALWAHMHVAVAWFVSLCFCKLCAPQLTVGAMAICLIAYARRFFLALCLHSQTHLQFLASCAFIMHMKNFRQ